MSPRMSGIVEKLRFRGDPNNVEKFDKRLRRYAEGVAV
jgi:hypothetical protein